MIQSNNQLITSQKKNIKNYRLSNNKNSKTITNLLEAKLVEFRISRARYHVCDLEGTSIIRLFKIADNIFKQISIEINKIITNDEKKRKFKTKQ